MTDQEARYDRIAEGYATWWSPVHRGATLRLLDEIETDVRQGARQVLDVGCGTGALAAAAVTRWPEVELDGADASAGMIAVAERERAALPAGARDRVRLRRADAERLPWPDGSFELVVSAFVLQLVPSRFRALREARRVLRPGGRLAYVTWMRGEVAFAADDAFDDALIAHGLEPRERGDDRHDLASPEAAVAQLRRAGFVRAAAHADVLTHAFTPEGFLGFLAQFDEEDRFASLEPELRARLDADLLARLRALPPAGLRLDLPIVYASGWRATDRG
jgi:ubiquinone/menaquinone biosynthesis C-methylase UbiE